MVTWIEEVNLLSSLVSIEFGLLSIFLSVESGSDVASVLIVGISKVLHVAGFKEMNFLG